MKKFNLYALTMLFIFFAGNSAFGQIKKGDYLEKATAAHGGTVFSFLNYSPDFHHAHDGDQCLASALTEDWIEKAGITEEYRAQEAYQNELVRRTDVTERELYTIPVIFHVIYNTPTENLSEADILGLLDEINEDFTASNPDVDDARGAYGFVGADADIEFCMAKENEVGVPLVEYGIHRVSTVETWFNPDTETNKMKSSTGGGTGTEGWDRDRYLNIWICDITNGAGSGVAGYAYKPTIVALPPSDIDGIVLDYNLGTTPGAHILTHEIGHFLGLDHTWGGGGGSCVTDDGLDDTPNNAGPSFDYGGSCSGDQETCGGTQTQYENFMDYSNCTCMYTVDQVDLMYLVLEGSRSDLTTSDVCDAGVPLPPVAQFEADIETVIEGGSVNFTDLSSNSPTTWNWVVSPTLGVSFIGGTSAASADPVIQFDNAGFYTITLTASNGEGSDAEVKTDYIEVIVGGDGTTDCDTSRNYTSDEFDNLAFYTVGSEAGYYPSQLTLDGGALLVEAYAEAFNAPLPTFVKRFRVPIFQADDIGGSSDVVFVVWDDAGGEPGATLGTQSVAIDDLDAGFWNIIDFPGGVAVSGDYWVGAVYDYSAGFDTVLFATTNFGDRPSGPSTTSTFISDGIGWTLTSDLFVSEPNASLIWDVLTSNGPSPVSVVSFPTTESCEGMEVTMNGFGSLNTTSYYWDITDGTDDYFYDEPNLTATFDEGTWVISLIADGSCESDVSADFTLVINPPMDVDVSINNENCTAADGEIDFSVSGGDGGPYQYSINDGATFFGSATFTGLTAGTYGYVIMDENNCEETGTAVVGNDNDFSPTISPDIIIGPGESTDLEVTGGITWSWYAGAIFISSDAMITVTPDVTTTYVCNVTDAEGCEAVLEVTVFIDDGSGIPGISLGKSLTVFPNPSNGNFNVQFSLIESKDLSIDVINILGDRVMSQSHQAVKDNTIQFDLSDVAPGVYFIILQSEDETVSKKMVIRK
ncbi:MAG: T9SS type A sorting domain-containing protein [Crocinitomix sp.]|nr:T9SS type A sorting domain-containing protein [Crocinitomix sp.]